MLVAKGILVQITVVAQLLLGDLDLYFKSEQD